MDDKTTETAALTLATVAATFVIPVENVGRLAYNMRKIARRAKKMAIAGAFHFEVLRTFLEERTVVEDSGMSRKVKAMVSEVQVTGPVVGLDGWALVGRLDFKAIPGATLRMMVPGETCPEEFQEAEATRCDHCGHRRRRNDSFIVRHEDGRQKVVGRTCLGDFLGADSPERLAKAAMLIMQACQDARDEEGSGGGADDVWGATQVLAVARYCIRSYGWTPSREEGSTKNEVAALLSPEMNPTAEKERLEELKKVTDADWDFASEALARIAIIEPKSDYIHNLKMVLTGEITHKTMGIAVSGVIAHQRFLDQDRTPLQATKKEGGFVGQVGERLNLSASVVLVRYIEGAYGVTTLIKFEDDGGNGFTWFASGGKDIEKGDRFDIRGTVKKFEEYQGRKSTVLTRCNLKKAP